MSSFFVWLIIELTIRKSYVRKQDEDFLKQHHTEAGRGQVMKEKRYFISDAAKELEVESHVLRYWEEELNLDIPRNEMGHRYYRDEEIQMLSCIKELKARGFQLRIIKQILTELQEGKGEAAKKLKKIRQGETETLAERMREEAEKETDSFPKKQDIFQEEETELLPRENTEKVVPIHREGFQQMTVDHDQKMQEFEEIMSKIIGQAMRENSHFLGEEVSEQVSGRVIKEMDYLMRLREEQEEKRFQSLDHTIRQYQKAKKEVAAASMAGGVRAGRKKKSRFFRKRRRKTI